MDCTLDRPALADALARVAGAVAGRTTRPILAGVLIRADAAGVTLTATDTELGVRVTLPTGPVLTDANGSAVIDLARFKQVVGAADTPTVRLTRTDGHGVEVRAGGKWTLPGYDPAEYPEFPAFPDGGHLEATAGTLRTLIKRTAYAADRKDSTRFALSGVLWECEPKAVRLVATDSKRLAVCEGPAVLVGDAPKGTHLLPSKAVNLLLANLADDGEAVRVCLRPNDAMFRTERAVIHTRLVEGRYPPYRDILKAAGKGDVTRITLPVAAFASRVRQAQICTDDESKRVDMVFADGRVTMAARGASSGSADVELELPDYHGPRVEIAFDPAYVLDFLKSLDGEPVVALEVTDGTKPAVLRCGAAVGLIMPLAG